MLNFVRTIPSRPPLWSVPRARVLISLWYGRWSSRHQLAHMDDRMLRDIGLGARERSHEVRKPFWQD